MTRPAEFVGLTVLGAAPVVAGFPWWGVLVIAAVCLVAYICRLYVVLRLGTQAIAKAGPAAMVGIMRAVTGSAATESSDPGNDEEPSEAGRPAVP
ncbi:hypothetical protein ACFWXK_13890 [Streptomyces sp. NPDC059070]|uniref:hypothetical protein n=1 Tax=Streptomyces sp. NPDC059070 TaxID=3346713 RepID=UPI0036884260